MPRSSYFANNMGRDFRDSDTTPDISQSLDSVRAWSWEITFYPPVGVEVPQTISKPLTVAAKSVQGIGRTLEDIVVSRVNDTVYYPGRPSNEELVVTFDNLLATKAGVQLHEYFKSIFDPTTGQFTTTYLSSPSQFKTKIEIIELNGAMEPQSVIKLLGCFPKKYMKAEKDYSANSFDTIEVTFRYDFLEIDSDTAN